MGACKIIIGIDEAGRGPLAGPVAVGAFAVRSMRHLKPFRNAKDSKQLSEKQRTEWFALIRSLHAKTNAAVSYAVSFTGEKQIDKHGLTKAVYDATRRCLKKLEKRGFAPDRSKVLLDGLLKAPSKYEQQKTIIGGDESEIIIALASICAKVLRDRKMTRLARKYPGYGFDIHKGYGTPDHYKAITKLGILPIHRQSFL